MSKQVKIQTPMGRKPEPDFLFFKTKNNGTQIDLEGVIYHDAKISTYSSFSTAQREMVQHIKNAKEQGGSAYFQIIGGKINGHNLDLDGLIDLKEMSKIGTKPDSDGLIDLLIKVEIEQ